MKHVNVSDRLGVPVHLLRVVPDARKTDPQPTRGVLPVGKPCESWTHTRPIA